MAHLLYATSQFEQFTKHVCVPNCRDSFSSDVGRVRFRKAQITRLAQEVRTRRKIQGKAKFSCYSFVGCLSNYDRKSAEKWFYRFYPFHDSWNQHSSESDSFPAASGRFEGFVVRVGAGESSTGDQLVKPRDRKTAKELGPTEEPEDENFTKADKRIFSITIYGVTTENDVRRLNVLLTNVEGLSNAWVGPIKEGGLRGGSVSVQIELDKGVTLRRVTLAIQSLENEILVLPFKTRSWPWRGYNINFAVAGCGKPIILVHGFGGNVGHFGNLISFLAEDYRVYAVDLLGFGASEKPIDAKYGPDLWAELVKDFAQEFASEGAVLVGNSIGSLTALATAALCGQQAVRGLVLLNCAGAMNRKGLTQDDRLLRAISPIFVAVEYLLQKPRIANFLFNRFRSKANIKRILQQQAYRSQEAVSDQLVDILYHPSTDPGALDVFVKVFTGDPGPRPENLMPKINSPVLLLWGDKDPWTPSNGPVAKYFEKLREEGANVKVELLPDVGHCPHDDRPELAAARIATFLSSDIAW